MRIRDGVVFKKGYSPIGSGKSMPIIFLCAPSTAVRHRYKVTRPSEAVLRSLLTVEAQNEGDGHENP